MKRSSSTLVALAAGFTLMACSAAPTSVDVPPAPLAAQPTPVADAGVDTDAEADDGPTDVPADDDALDGQKPVHYWPGGVVPYAVDPSLAASTATIQAAAGTINAKTHMVIRPKTEADLDYVLFRATSGPASNSAIGRRGGEQAIHLSATGGKDPRTVMHELGHAIGLVHEQQRPDRNDYVTVQYDCVKDGYQKQFDISPRIRAEQKATPFDFDSIMLYGSQIFATSKQCPAMLKKSDGKPFQGMGAGVGLSPGMIRLFDTIARAQ